MAGVFSGIQGGKVVESVQLGPDPLGLGMQIPWMNVTVLQKPGMKGKQAEVFVDS